MTIKEVAEKSNGNNLSFVKKNCIYRLDLFYCGWDMDTEAWIMEDGTIFGTNHGKLEVVTKNQFNEYKKQIKDAFKELEEVTKLVA